ncbi:MAG: hypothetical protein ACON35_02305 [Candidatus Marinamargulisbacteria bacterium]
MGIGKITKPTVNKVGGGTQQNLSSVGQSVNKRDTTDISALIKANESKSDLNTNLTMVNDFLKALKPSKKGGSLTFLKNSQLINFKRKIGSNKFPKSITDNRGKEKLQIEKNYIDRIWDGQFDELLNYTEKSPAEKQRIINNVNEQAGLTGSHDFLTSDEEIAGIDGNNDANFVLGQLRHDLEQIVTKLNDGTYKNYYK